MAMGDYLARVSKGRTSHTIDIRRLGQWIRESIESRTVRKVWVSEAAVQEVFIIPHKGLLVFITLNYHILFIYKELRLREKHCEHPRWKTNCDPEGKRVLHLIHGRHTCLPVRKPRTLLPCTIEYVSVPQREINATAFYLSNYSMYSICRVSTISGTIVLQLLKMWQTCKQVS